MKNLWTRHKFWIGPIAAASLFALIVGSVVGVIAQPGGITPNFATMFGATLGADPGFQCGGLDTNVSCNIVTKGTGALKVNGTAITGAGSSLTLGTLTVTGNATFNGLQLGQIGTSGVTHPDGGTPLFFNATDTPTTGTVLQTLYSFSLPANSLTNTAGQRLHIKTAATAAATANNKTYTVAFGATTIFTTTAAAFNNSLIAVDCDLWITGVNTQKAICWAIDGSTRAASAIDWNVTTPAENPTGPINIITTGTTPTVAGDLTARDIAIVYYPTP